MNVERILFVFGGSEFLAGVWSSRPKSSEALHVGEEESEGNK